MRSFVIGLLASLIFVGSVAHASSDGQGSFAKGNSTVSAKAARPNHSPSTRPQTYIKRSAGAQSDLTLANPQISPQTSSPALESINSLASGSAPINPWFPERGAIGVRVKVTW